MIDDNARILVNSVLDMLIEAANLITDSCSDLLDLKTVGNQTDLVGLAKEVLRLPE